MGQIRKLAAKTQEKDWVASLSNIAEILAFAGLIIANLVSIFSKVQDRPLTEAQAEKARAEATAALNQGWKEYADQINADNDRLRQEMEEKSKRCAEEIAALRKQVEELKKQINGKPVSSSSASA